MDLDNSFSARHRVVVHVGVEKVKLPAMNAFILLASNLSPMPAQNVPEMIVTFSLFG